MTPDRQATSTAERSSRTRPVRSAPIKRNRTATTPAKRAASSTTPASDTASDTTASETTGSDTTGTDTIGTDTIGTDTAVTSVSLVKSDAPATGDITPDPSELEKTLSYRERRRARLAKDTTTAGAGGSRTIRYRGTRSLRSPRAVIGVVVAIVVIVVCAVASTIFALGISRQQNLDELRSEYSSFASQVLINLTSMNPETVDQTLTSVQQDTTGKVKAEIEDNIGQVAALVRDGKLETTSLVLSSAVTKAEEDEGSVIMVFGWNQRSLDGSIPPQQKVFRWRVDMTRINGDLKMTDFEWVA